MLLVEKLKKFIMKYSRKKKLDQFYSLCGTEVDILDVGVAKNEYNEQVNLFLNEFRLNPSFYTGLAIESMESLRKKHPEKRFVEYTGGEFPFQNDEFDWVFSNAVIEHVGDEEMQVNFINEMLRVSKNVFFTTPNKYFPVEAHTNTVFRHWNNYSFYKWCKKKRLSWSAENLVLLSYNDIAMLLDKSNAKKYKIIKNRILFYTMTFTIICSK